MALLPKVKLKAVVSFPANVYGGAGITVSYANGNYTVATDYSKFAVLPVAPSGSYTLVYNPLTGGYGLAPGAVGPVGPAGPAGPTGPTGPSGSGSGDVIGPAGAVNNNIAVFDLATGKLIKDSGTSVTAAAGAVRYDSAQGLTAAQKTQAHTNLYIPPTIQKFLSGSGTYTKPANVKWIEVIYKGGGGGASGSSGGTIGGGGGNGGNTTFGAGSANGGGGGAPGSGGSQGGSGGTGNLGAGLGDVIIGQGGTSVTSGVVAGPSGAGDGGGIGMYAGAAGGNAAANSGGGGGGGGGNSGSSGSNGSAGGEGCLVREYIFSPSATYAYAVGAGGVGGTAGSLGVAGGAGGSGYITVIEHYAS